MDADVLETALLVVWVLAAVILSIFSAVSLGRKLADLEYIDGGKQPVRQIQAWVNIRTYANRLLLGLTFGTAALMASAGVPTEWRQWISRVLFIAVILSFAAASVADWHDDRRILRLLLRRPDLIPTAALPDLTAEIPPAPGSEVPDGAVDEGRPAERDDVRDDARDEAKDR